MNSFIKTFVAALAACLLTMGTAEAHYLWIEQTGNGTRLYYGEADVLLKEKSPGKLDNIKAPQAFSTAKADGKPNPATVSRAADHFVINGDKAARAWLVADESSEVRDLTKHGLGIAKTNYYARQGQPGSSEGPSPLALDISRRGPKTFVVLYGGQPLKNARLEVIAPNTWSQEHKTNDQGIVEINTPWRGQYVLHVLHIDKRPGEFAGQQYDNLRNHFTYTFNKRDGASPGPAVPPTHAPD